MGEGAGRPGGGCYRRHRLDGALHVFPLSDAQLEILHLGMHRVETDRHLIAQAGAALKVDVAIVLLRCGTAEGRCR